MAERDAALRARIQERLLAEQRDLFSIGSRWERRVRVREAVARLLAQETEHPAGAAAETLVREIADSVVGLGPLEPLLADESVSEVMVNGPSRVFVERAGVLERVPVTFEDARAVLHVIDRIVAPLGLRVDESRPWVDARLPDGSRVHAIVPPLAVQGPALTIRRFGATSWTLDRLVRLGAIARREAALLREAVRAKRSILVSGGAGAGKTTLLRALAAEIPEGERVVTIEDAAELRLEREHVVALETRPPNVEGAGVVTVRDLVRNALRMRPDRIVVGEVRGGEVIDMLQAMNTGHAGSMSTIHANSAADVLPRIEAMALTADPPLFPEATRRQLAAALDLVVHVERARAVRALAEICEVRDGGSLGTLFRREPHQ